jgi:hypothetical protein
VSSDINTYTLPSILIEEKEENSKSGSVADATSGKPKSIQVDKEAVLNSLKNLSFSETPKKDEEGSKVKSENEGNGGTPVSTSSSVVAVGTPPKPDVPVVVIQDSPDKNSEVKGKEVVAEKEQNADVKKEENEPKDEEGKSDGMAGVVALEEDKSFQSVSQVDEQTNTSVTGLTHSRLANVSNDGGEMKNILPKHTAPGKEN